MENVKKFTKMVIKIFAIIFAIATVTVLIRTTELTINYVNRGFNTKDALEWAVKDVNLEIDKINEYLKEINANKYYEKHYIEYPAVVQDVQSRIIQKQYE